MLWIKSIAFVDFHRNLQKANLFYSNQTEVNDLFPFSRRQAVLCILSESCDEPQYKQLITALCSEHQIPLIRVDSSKKLGEWSGLCKIDKEGKPRKICGCSCVVVKTFGEETQALDIVKNHLRSN